MKKSKKEKQSITTIKNRVQSKIQQARSYVTTKELRAEELIRKNPKVAAAIAASVGAIIGATVLALRRHAKHDK